MKHEKRLIEYAAVYKYAFDGVHGGGLEDEDFDVIINAIDAVPTVDAVEVVRCKDCKWYKESKLMPPIRFCYRLIGNDGKPVGYNFSDDDFCSRGERKDNGNR